MALRDNKVAAEEGGPSCVGFVLVAVRSLRCYVETTRRKKTNSRQPFGPRNVSMFPEDSGTTAKPASERMPSFVI